MSNPIANEWIRAIHAYVPGSSAAAGKARPVKLSSNENPWGPSPLATAALAQPHDVHRYPDGTAIALRQKLAELHGLDPELIVCGTGSDELLQLLPLIYCDHGDSVLYMRHGFMVYPIASRRAGAVPLAVPDLEYTADVDGLLAAVRADTRVVFLANPNNPTGTMISSSEVARLHAGLRPDIVLVVDQAYAEYLDSPDPDGGLHLARTTNNVVVTRTFSKIYGLGGLRVGWATGPAAIIAELNRVRAPFPVSVPALAACEAALDDQAHVATCRQNNAEQRAVLTAGINRLAAGGLGAVPSSANFVLMTCPEAGPNSAENLHRSLMERGYITRWLPGQGLPHALRISVGTAEETAGLVAVLAELVNAG